MRLHADVIVMQPLHCRNSWVELSGFRIVAMTATWFVSALAIKSTRPEKKALAREKMSVSSGEPMLLTRREAMAGCGGGLAMLMGLPALAQALPSRTVQ